MRALLALVVVVILVLIIGVATGFIKLSGQSGSLPKVAVEGGSLPKVDADVGKVVVGTKSTSGRPWTRLRSSLTISGRRTRPPPRRSAVSGRLPPTRALSCRRPIPSSPAAIR